MVGNILKMAVRGVLLAALATPALESAWADTTGPAPRPEADNTLGTVVVTGSYLRRTDAETPSPVTVIGEDEIRKSGLTSISDVIRQSSADNGGSLTQAFSGAMAGGASGISLRGLSVDATLVLVDGHRMAPYPLADDGQRSFVDISSLPMGIVDRVEILKDGASALYGSDAIAGVVNVILKKQFVGLEIDGSAGASYKGDGITQRYSALWGSGDLGKDGHNVYANIEYRHQSSISQENRGSYLNQLDLTSYGGPDLRGGVPGSLPYGNSAYTLPGQVLPQNADPNSVPFYLLPGCSAQNTLPNEGCAWDTNKYKKIQPMSEGLNATVHWSQRLGDAWTSSAALSYFLSNSEQYRQSNLYNAPVTLVPFAWGGSRGASINQFDPTSTNILLPANHPDNPFNPSSSYFAAAQAFYTGQGYDFSQYIGQPALFYGALSGVPPMHSIYRTQSARFAEDLTGDVGGWAVTASFGYSHLATRIRYEGYVRASLLGAALASGTFRVGQNESLNPASLYAQIAPVTEDTAVSQLAYLSVTGARTLAQLPGGELGLATGAEVRTWHLDNPGEPFATQGDVIMDGSFYARGTQSVGAAFAELSAPLTHTLELDGAARLDRYSGWGASFTPKVGFKWKIQPSVALRGTFARGFRAPGISENGDAGTATSVAPAPQDPYRCPNPPQGSILDCGLPGSSIALITGANPNLKPERSRSYTIGFIVEPLRHVSLTVDYFNIRRDGEITSAPYDPTPGTGNALRAAPAPGEQYGPIIMYLTPYVNASYSLVSGIDFELKTATDLGVYGKLTTRLQGTHLNQQQQTFGDTTYHFVGTVGPTSLGGSVGTPALKGAWNAEWSRGPLSLGGTFYYHSAMKGIDESRGSTSCLQLSATNPHCYVAGFGYLEAYGQLSVNEHLDLTATVANVTNRLAPLNNVTYGGQNYNPSLDLPGAVGRFFEISARYRF
jgi:iron complex outermembrane receptor protein